MVNNKLNWSYFKPDFFRKTQRRCGSTLTERNDWMTTHDFPEDQKVRRFCLTILGEAMLWYETLNAPQQQLTWEDLQDRFRQQYSKIQ